MKLKRYFVNGVFDGNCFVVIYCNFFFVAATVSLIIFLVIVWMRCRRNFLLVRYEERGAIFCRIDSLIVFSVCRFNGVFCVVCSVCW